MVDDERETPFECLNVQSEAHVLWRTLPVHSRCGIQARLQSTMFFNHNEVQLLNASHSVGFYLLASISLSVFEHLCLPLFSTHTTRNSQTSVFMYPFGLELRN